MTPLTEDEFRFLTLRAGLSIPDAELLELKRLYDAFQERLQPLYDTDLSEEEVAGIFLPGASGPTSAKEVAP